MSRLDSLRLEERVERRGSLSRTIVEPDPHPASHRRTQLSSPPRTRIVQAHSRRRIVNVFFPVTARRSPRARGTQVRRRRVDSSGRGDGDLRNPSCGPGCLVGRDPGCERRRSTLFCWRVDAWPERGKLSGVHVCEVDWRGDVRSPGTWRARRGLAALHETRKRNARAWNASICGRWSEAESEVRCRPSPG